LPHPVRIRANIKQADTVKNLVKFMDGTLFFAHFVRECP